MIESFRNYLRENNLPITAQRLAIADILLGSSEHFSVEEIMIELGARGAYAGTATVYRTIELLLSSGLVVERDFGEGFKRFEAARGIPQHEHLQCTVCGRLLEFRDERLERMTVVIAENRGFERTGHKLVITGICESCKEKMRRADDVKP